MQSVGTARAPSTRWVLFVGLVVLIAGVAYWQQTQEPPKSAVLPMGSGSLDATPPTLITPVAPGTSWQIQLSGTVDPTVLDHVANPHKLYDVDLVETSPATIAQLKAKGITVICYLSAGTAETYRPDYPAFSDALKGHALADYPDEFWLDIRDTDTLLPVMQARMDLAVAKGCDGIDPDNVNGYTNESGFPLSYADQLVYNRLLAYEAHARGLSIGLKNDLGQLHELVDVFDWALNEQCHEFGECEDYQVFIQQDKAVLGIEYRGEPADFCPQANAANYDFLRKELALGAQPRTACRLD